MDDKRIFDLPQAFSLYSIMKWLLFTVHSPNDTLHSPRFATTLAVERVTFVIAHQLSLQSIIFIDSFPGYRRQLGFMMPLRDVLDSLSSIIWEKIIYHPISVIIFPMSNGSWITETVGVKLKQPNFSSTLRIRGIQKAILNLLLIAKLYVAGQLKLN